MTQGSDRFPGKGHRPEVLAATPIPSTGLAGSKSVADRRVTDEPPPAQEAA